MRKLFSLIMFLACTNSIYSQTDYVTVEFNGGISSTMLKNKMERNAARLLTAINRAYTQGSNYVNYTNCPGLPTDVQTSIGIIWKNAAHFHTAKTTISEPCLQIRRNNTIRGYQLRNIEMMMDPVGNQYQDDLVQEFCINFDARGNITDFKQTIETHQYNKLIENGEELDDYDRRVQIIDFCEQLKTAYNKKDLDFMKMIFSDDALIVTGKKINRLKINREVPLPNSNYEYSVQTKEQYIKGLSNVFKNAQYINVKFDGYEIRRHPSLTRRNYYSVTLKQSWFSKNWKNSYADEGIVTLIWDFRDEENPRINVRTWMPIDTPENELPKIEHFKFND